MPVPLGEEFLAIVSSGKGAYVLTVAREPSSLNSPSVFYAYHLDLLGHVGPVTTFTVPNPSWFPRASLVTGTTDLVYGFLETSQRSYAFVWDRQDIAVRDIPDLRTECGGGKLAMTLRSASRLWFYFGSMAWGSCTPKFSLVESEDRAVVTLADDVVWAGCTSDSCSQLRLEGDFLRLYANPASSDAYLFPVTEVEWTSVPSLPYRLAAYVPAEPPTTETTVEPTNFYVSCATPSRGLVFAFNDRLFFVDVSSPVIRPVPAAIAHNVITEVRTSCLYAAKDDVALPTQERIVARTHFEREIDDNCGPLDRLWFGCFPVAVVDETWVTVFDSDGERQANFPLHDY